MHCSLCGGEQGVANDKRARIKRDPSTGKSFPSPSPIQVAQKHCFGVESVKQLVQSGASLRVELSSILVETDSDC